MKKYFIILFAIIAFPGYSQETKKEKEMNYNKLNQFEKYVILDKGTEPPFTGK